MNRTRLFLRSRKIRLQDDRETEEHENNNAGGGIIRNDDTRTICLIGCIDERQLADFHATLFDFFKQPEPITLFICSHGGCTSETAAIYDLIKTSPVPITTIGYGYLESGGLIIYLAGGKRLLLPQARLMFHWAVGNVCSEMDQDSYGRETAYVSGINRAMKNIFKTNTKLSEQQIKTFMHNSKVLSAEEAVRWGLAHEIIHTLPVNFPKSKRKK